MGVQTSSNVSKHSVALQEEISQPHVSSVKRAMENLNQMVWEGSINHLFTMMYVVVRKLFEMLKNFKIIVLRILHFIMLKMVNQCLIGYSFIYHPRK